MDGCVDEQAMSRSSQHLELNVNHKRRRAEHQTFTICCAGRWQKRQVPRLSFLLLCAVTALIHLLNADAQLTVPPARPGPLPGFQRLSSWASAAAAVLVLQTSAEASLAAPPGKISVSVPELVRIVTEDFTARRYLVTGDLTKEVYADNAHFADSNNDFGPGLDSWVRGVKLLFKSERCKLALTQPVSYDEAKRTITFEGWRQVDVFNLPGAPHTPVFTGRTTLLLDPVENIIVDHTEKWDQTPDEIKSGLKFFDDGFNPPGFESLK
eukprot:TRINITY_DN27022_c0_g1_i1.p1 TRINITY_DN27022_c0_g1~~TRINITY_DN27022_c0_g1_i1.p1  ORF type:complete len:267 (+),score=38.38 TRINITY_DN27022_c0_g1_i1:64-864(+)